MSVLWVFLISELYCIHLFSLCYCIHLFSLCYCISLSLSWKVDEDITNPDRYLASECVLPACDCRFQLHPLWWSFQPFINTYHSYDVVCDSLTVLMIAIKCSVTFFFKVMPCQRNLKCVRFINCWLENLHWNYYYH